MAGLFDKQAEKYAKDRPDYSKELFSWFADRTSDHLLAWDVGTGNGQAALAVAEHYKQVIATDISEQQLQHAKPHPRVKYIHTKPDLSNDEIVSLIGPENSFDLITVAQAVHWFDLPNFYSLVNRLLKKPGGIIAVWCYNNAVVNPDFDVLLDRFHKTTLPFWDPRARFVFEAYKTVPFPFESVGLGSEGQPLEVDIVKKMSFKEFVGMLESWSGVVRSREKGVDLLNQGVIDEMANAWGGFNVVRSVVYKAHMIVGKVKVTNYNVG